MKLHDLGDKLIRFRTECDLSQDKFGKKVGVSRQTVSNWESKRGSITLASLKKVCKAFDIGLDYFVPEAVAIAEDVAEASEEKEVAASCVVEEKVEKETLPETPIQENVTKHKKMSVRAIKLTIALSVCGLVLLFLLFVILSYACAPKFDGTVIEEVSSVTFNFSFDNIAKILFVVVLFVAASIATHFILKEMERKEKVNKIFQRGNYI